MNKIAKYLNEHLLGEVVVNPGVRNQRSTDASPLSYQPEMVVYPRVTNDIRKVARFSWQLAEKGHVIGLTPRGSGSDKTGAAIGPGIVLSMPAYMNEIFELDPKQKLIRLQPGVTIRNVNDALNTRGLALPAYAHSKSNSTIGGIIANNSKGHLSGKYGGIGEWIEQLEVVLASGDVLQTGRLGKRELQRVKGLPGYEGDIYRKIDGLIEDNRKLIEEKISGGASGGAGYPGIAEVKRRDGSFDLAPLLVGSQGTLGVISEMILRTDFVAARHDLIVTAFESIDYARDAYDELARLKPAFMDIYDSRLFKEATRKGKKYSFFAELPDNLASGVVVIMAFDDFGRVRARKVKRAVKYLTGRGAPYQLGATGEVGEAGEIEAMMDIPAAALLPDTESESALPLLDGAQVPLERLESFAKGVAELAKKHHVELPLYGRMLEGVFYTRPTLQLRRVGDKQKVFKLIDQYFQLVAAHGGEPIGEQAEGRLKAPFARRELDSEVKELYDKIREAFDPHGTMNPGVKQEVPLKELVAHLRTEYDVAPRPIGE